MSVWILSYFKYNRRPKPHAGVLTPNNSYMLCLFQDNLLVLTLFKSRITAQVCS